MDPFLQTIHETFQRMHADFETAIDGLPQEALDWVPGEGMNSITVLISHTAGADRYWIGEFIGGEPSGRVRDEEFTQRGQTAGALVNLLRETLAMIERTLSGISMAELDEVRASPPHGRSYSKAWALVHMIDHTATHLGHVQVTRQLWDAR